MAKASAAVLRTLIAVAAVCACALTGQSARAQCQAISAKWEVKRADWGAVDQRMDVTQRLRQMLYTNADSQIRVDSVTLGFDPAEGREKTLRVFAENAASAKKMLTYKEGETVDPHAFETGATTGEVLGLPAPYKSPRLGTLYAAEQRPAPAAPIEIIAAYYGNGDQYNNVTCILEKMVQNGRLVVDVTSENMGGDPAIGATKVLSVIFRVHGGPERSTTVIEGDTLRIPTEASPQSEPSSATSPGEKSGLSVVLKKIAQGA